MSSNYAPCFNRIDFVVIASYIELPWLYKEKSKSKVFKSSFKHTQSLFRLCLCKCKKRSKNKVAGVKVL